MRTPPGSRQNVKTPPKQGLDTSRGGCYLCARRCLDRLYLCRVMLDLVLVHLGGSGRSRGSRGRRGRCCRGRCRSLGERGGSEQRCNQSGSELLHLILQRGGGEATILASPKCHNASRPVSLTPGGWAVLEIPIVTVPSQNGAFRGAARLDVLGGGTPVLVQRPRVVAYFTDWAAPRATQHPAHESLQSTLPR